MNINFIQKMRLVDHVPRVGIQPEVNEAWEGQSIRANSTSQLTKVAMESPYYNNYFR